MVKDPNVAVKGIVKCKDINGVSNRVRCEFNGKGNILKHNHLSLNEALKEWQLWRIKRTADNGSRKYMGQWNRDPVLSYKCNVAAM